MRSLICYEAPRATVRSAFEYTIPAERIHALLRICIYGMVGAAFVLRLRFNGL